MLEHLVEQIREEQPDAQIELMLSASPLHTAGDEMLLRQIFENVIVNGIKYSPLRTPIAVSAVERGSAVRVVVSDQGSGMAHDELSRVRHAYYRGSNSKGTSGAGLGLYVVERLVEAHHGRLLIESEIGCGTRVSIDLPLINAPAVA